MKFFYAIILLVVALTFVAADEQEDENDWSSYKVIGLFAHCAKRNMTD